MMLYQCGPCGFECAKPSGLARHERSQKHQEQMRALKPQSSEKRCEACGKGYASASGLWKHQQRCAPDLRSLLLDQKRQQDELLEQLKVQQAQLAELAVAPRVTTTHNTTNNVLVFLNTDCGNAVNWSDFVAGLTVELEGDVTESIVKTVCAGIRELGVHRRPIHCVDVKRCKLYLKTDNVWENDAGKIREALRASHTVLQNQCRAMLQAWNTTHPEWKNHDAEVERYRRLAVQVTEGVDEERCTFAISKSVGL
jgi:hypothetical protein